MKTNKTKTKLLCEKCGKEVVKLYKFIETLCCEECFKANLQREKLLKAEKEFLEN
jgi:hypothetical protein